MIRPPRRRLRALLGMALWVTVALAVRADAASAHAVLLGTDPAPQTTTARPPSSVRLSFSEAVEVTFGAVRIYDVDGRRVVTGALRRTGGNRQVVVATPGLRAGTYTVTWRAVSADGHPVHGGFTFYAVTPSTVSAVAVAGDTGAGRVVGWGFGVLRFVWFAAFVGLVGLAVVRRWVWTPALRQLELDQSAAAVRFRALASRWLVTAWVLMFAAGASSIVFESASASGLSLGAAAHPSVIRQLIGTSYGRLWVVQMALTAVLAAPVTALARARRTLAVPPDGWLALLGAGLGGLAAVSALSGHARTLGHANVGVPALAVHLVAVGVWVGGLAALVLAGGPAWGALAVDDRRRLLGVVIPRFSRVAIDAVAIVVATGTLNATFGLASVSDLWKVTYGRIVLAKVGLLGVALVLAARHLWVTPRRLADDDRDRASSSFRLTSRVELAVLAAVVALAAGLVASVPGRSQALALASGAVAQEHRAGDYTIQVFADPGRAGSNDIHLTYVDARGLAAAEVVTAAATVAPLGGDGRQPLALRLLSPGHFVASLDLAAGRYTVVVGPGSGKANPGSTFHLTIGAQG